MVYVLEDKHFNWFKSCATELINKLGLFDWHISFEMSELDGDIAQCRMNRTGKQASLVLNSVYYDREPTEENIRQHAYHEVLELLLDDVEAPCWITSLSDEDKQDAVNKGRHSVIYRLLRLL